MTRSAVLGQSADQAVGAEPRDDLARSLLASVTAKFLVMVTSALFGLLTARLILGHFGVEAYAHYGLLAGLAALVPFADLGLSAAIMNAAGEAQEPRTSAHLRKVLLSAFRLLLLSALVIAAGTLLITMAGWWPALLGGGLLQGGEVAAAACAFIFALSVPLGVGQRLLTGLRRNHLLILIQGASAPLVLALVLLAVYVGWSGRWLPVFTYAASGAVAFLALVVSAWMIRPQVVLALRAVPRLRREPGEPVFHIAGPMLVMVIALPLAMQTDRLLLSHFGRAADLAEYNLSFQLFNMVIQVAGAGGMALWPFFAKARAEGAVRSPFTLTAIFTIVGLTLTGVLVLVHPWLVSLIAGDSIKLAPATLAAFAWLAVVQTSKWPLGMYMTDAAGLRFQVLPILMMLPFNLVLSYLLIPVVGAAGPVFGSAASVTLFQLLPSLWFVRADLDRRRTQGRSK